MISPAARAKAVRTAGDWILRSGIQVRNAKLPVHGAFNAWYDLASRRPQYVYPEITGYGITTLLYMDSLTGSSRLLPRACEAGDWAVRRAMHACGGIRPRDYYAREERAALFSFERHLVVIFDSGMVLFGLTNLYKASRRPAYLRAARRVGDFLVDRAQKGNGLFYACFNPGRRSWIDQPDKWSTQSGSYHAKLALGLLGLHRLTGLGKYGRGAEKICRASLKLQRPSGRFVSYGADGSTHMHPHLYSAEGMLAAGLGLGRPDLLRSAARAARWSLSQQLSDGGLPCLVSGRGLRNDNQRSDTLAQALRLGTLCRALGLLPASVQAPLARLESRLLAHQKSGAPQSGGFRYGREMNGEERGHLNFWCTAFAYQALAMRERALSGRIPDASLFV